MHICFCEEHVEDAIEEVEGLVRAVEERIEENGVEQ